MDELKKKRAKAGYKDDSDYEEEEEGEIIEEESKDDDDYFPKITPEMDNYLGFS